MITDEESIKNQIAAFPYWYHKIELRKGIITPGWAPIDKRIYNIPADMTGMRVLDIGAWDGFWTFEALKRGARQVVAIDDFSDYIGELRPEDRQKWATFDFCKKVLGFDDEQCQRKEMSVYEVCEESTGVFDIIFFFGTLYHLRHPLLALDNLAKICTDAIYIETAILDDYSPYRGGIGHGYPDGQLVMEFYPQDQLGHNYSNWWVPTLHCLGQMILASGFEKADLWKLTDHPKEPGLCRGFAKGVKVEHAKQPSANR
ncbi:MAG: DUF1698 domain-containing protein [Nitrospirae bacterium]|nr:DUF1698 domain-containing protein [Nitrospirota bacterium]